MRMPVIRMGDERRESEWTVARSRLVVLENLARRREVGDDGARQCAALVAGVYLCD